MLPIRINASDQVHQGGLHPVLRLAPARCPVAMVLASEAMLQLELEAEGNQQ
jgi:hypothetical protein